MIIERYAPTMFDDLIKIHLTQKSETADLIQPEHVPEIGFIAKQDTTPIAIGFLRRLEGGFAQIDTLVTNADLNSSTRNEGLSAVVKKLLDTAKTLKLHGLLFTTAEPTIIRRAEELGFRQLNQVVMVKSVT